MFANLHNSIVGHVVVAYYIAVLVWKTNFHRFGMTAYDDIWLLHIVCFGNRVCLVCAEITFDFVFFRCTHFKDAIIHLLSSEPNQIF